MSIPSFAPSLASLSFPFPLRKYQVEGISWLLFLRSHGLHGVLADDMGLGKTVQVLAAVAIDALDRSSPSSSVPSTSLPASLTRARPHLPSLVVCPSSLLYHWEKECARLCSLNPSVPLKPILYSSARALSPSPTDIVIASYGAVRQSSSVFSAVDWAFVVLDEV